jgi:hypothetical protein
MLLNQKNIPDAPGLVTKIDLTTSSGPDTSECLINANNDLEATLHWLALYSAKKTTFKSYHREGLCRKFKIKLFFSTGVNSLGATSPPKNKTA